MIAREIDGGELYAQLKAPTRVRDLTTGELRYRWTETGALDHYRHAHAFDHIAADIARQNPPACMGVPEFGGERESARLHRELGLDSCGSNGWVTHHWPRRGSWYSD